MAPVKNYVIVYIVKYTKKKKKKERKKEKKERKTLRGPLGHFPSFKKLVRVPHQFIMIHYALNKFQGETNIHVK